MPSYLTPGVYLEELKSAVQPIEGISTSTAAFIGVAVKGPVNQATLVTSLTEFVKTFGGPIPIVTGAGGQEHYLYYSVRHFFAEGGRRCFIVRVTGYGDINDANTLQAVSAYRDVDAVRTDGTTTEAGALRISAKNPGKWGEGLRVRVENASKFSVLLAESVTASTTLTQLTLRDNQDVLVGSVLQLVEQVTGIVKSVDPATNTIKFLPGVTAETVPPPDPFTISTGAKAFSPDMKFMSTVTTGGNGSIGVTTEMTVTLASVQTVNGGPLQTGDVVNFTRGASALVVVKRFVPKLLSSGETGMLVEFEPPGLPALAAAHTKAYARDFDVLVEENGVVVETHRHLSLIDSNRRDHVKERLGPASAESRLIVAAEKAGTSGAVIANAPFANLSGGDDGLAGTPAFGADDIVGSERTGTGLHALDAIKDASILVIPNAPSAVAKAAMAYCEQRKDLFLVMDLPSGVADPVAYVADKASSYAAIYYPWIVDLDPLTGKQVALPPSGAVAGSYAQTDVSRGVHKAPAGVENGFLDSATGIQKVVTKGETDLLYQRKVNVIRKFPEGILIFGARTLAAEPAWRYVNVRRLFIFLEQSIERGLQWVVFEPNDYSLWKSIKRNVSAFLRVQWEEGKLVGGTEDKAFYVRCDETINSPDVVNAGQVIAEIGVAPSKPAEFVVFRFKQFIAKAK